MGNEQSSELSPEELEAEAQLRAQIRTETMADLDRRKAIAIEKIREEQRQAEVRKPHTTAKALSATDATNLNKTTSQMNKEQTSSTTMAIRSLEASQEEGEIVETPDSTINSEDVLKRFNPRKEPRDRDPRAPKAHAQQTTKSNSDGAAQDQAGRSTVIPSDTKKRAAPSQNVNADERRAALSSLPKIAKRSSVASPESPDRVAVQSNKLAAVRSSGQNERPPRWYKNLTVKNARGKNEADADTILTGLRDQISKAQGNSRGAVPAQTTLSAVRDRLHKIMFVKVNEQLLKRNRMLHNEEGLPQIFDEIYSNGVTWPFDIKADAEELYNKWSKRIFETDLMRGINFSVRAARDAEGAGSGDSVDPAHKVSAKYHGNGDLLNGQWWPMQICALRDGAHGEKIAGITGETGDGAYSVVMSGGHDYVDEDYGDEVRYCGTDSTDSAITENTRRMLESVGNQPVRLIRSHKLDSPFAPKFGMRYDGLYDVVSSKNIDGTNSVRQRHVFKLVRRNDQDPIRGGNGPETRPTVQEIQAYKEHRRFAGRE